MGERLRPTVKKVEETPEEYMMSAVFGLELTQEQIDAAKAQPKPKQSEVLFGPIARRWHQEHPVRETDEFDERNLLGS